MKLQKAVIPLNFIRFFAGLAGMFIFAWSGDALAAEEPTGYRTPLAGEERNLSFMGRELQVPARNRDNCLSLTVGGIAFSPQLGGDTALPIAALYWRHRWEETRARAVVAVFVNEADVARSFGAFELLGHWENDTVPFSQAEIVNGSEFKESSIIWGSFSGWLGAGWRRPLAPFQEDNDLRLQLFYHAGYLYSKPVADTGARVRLPPDTFVHGVRFRGRVDGLRRNLLELPHEGWAGGWISSLPGETDGRMPITEGRISAGRAPGIM